MKMTVFLRKSFRWIFRSNICQNIFLNDMDMRISNYEYNKSLTKFQKEISQLDIFCSEEIIESNKRVESFINQHVAYVAFSRVFVESLHYGHLNAIFEYAGLNMLDAIYFPRIEHGIHLEAGVSNYLHGSIAVMGNDRKKCIRNTFPDMPIFKLGPYIHYTQPFYDDYQFSEIKNRWRNTLLIIPHHSCEGGSYEYDIDSFVKKIINTYAKQFNTVVACLYWKDFDTELYHVLTSYGVEIVTAGYRWDSNFIKRLKTIISFSDFVISNSIGTHIGYCIYLDKPLLYIDTQEKVFGRDVTPHSACENTAYDYLIVEFPKQKDIIEQKALCAHYWGFDEIKSKKEIKDIYQVNKTILLRCLGDYEKYNLTVRNLLKKCRNDDYYKVLSDALS